MSVEDWSSSYSYEGVTGPYTQESGGDDTWETHLDGRKYNPEGEVTIAVDCGLSGNTEANNEDDDRSDVSQIALFFGYVWLGIFLGF